MNANIMVLGTGNAQLDLIDYCRNRDFTVIGCGNSISRGVAECLDHYEDIDITDTDGVLKLAQKHDVDIVYSIGSDVAMTTVAFVSEKLKLPCFISTETAEKCRSKTSVRKILDDADSNIDYAEYGSEEDAGSYRRFPGMMKPVDSQGQRGCFRVGSTKDINEKFQISQSFSKERKVIIESYIEGHEVSVNVYMAEGRMVFFAVSDRFSFEEMPGGIVKKHVMPSSIDAHEQEMVKSAAVDAVGRIGIENGPVYMQMKLDRDGVPRIIEISPRLDGCHLWKLVQKCYGIDLLDMCMDHLLKGTPPGDSVRIEAENTLELSFLCQPPGKVFSSEGFGCWEGDEKVLYYEDGSEVKAINGHMEKCGYVIRTV